LAHEGEAMTLLPWPEPFVDNPEWKVAQHYAMAYEHQKAMTEAALQRLRVAVALLADIGAEELTPYPNEYGGTWADAAKKALEHIGEVPE
jgi:hypothetical protein